MLGHLVLQLELEIKLRLNWLFLDFNIKPEIRESTIVTVYYLAERPVWLALHHIERFLKSALWRKTSKPGFVC